jgi:hypothetical protein
LHNAEGPAQPRRRLPDHSGHPTKKLPKGRSTISEKRFENAVLGAIDTGG